MSSDDRRHVMEEKTFAVLTAESINAMAESAGLQPVPHEAAAALGEDVSYRMRQLVMVCPGNLQNVVFIILLGILSSGPDHNFIDKKNMSAMFRIIGLT